MKTTIPTLAILSLAVVVMMSVVSLGRAAITTSGDVTPDPTTTTLSDDLFVGNTADGNMTVNGGSPVENNLGYVGLNTGSTSMVTVTGTGSTWTTNSGNLDSVEGGRPVPRFFVKDSVC